MRIGGGGPGLEKAIVLRSKEIKRKTAMAVVLAKVDHSFAVKGNQEKDRNGGGFGQSRP
jgi:hypothetical protein